MRRQLPDAPEWSEPDRADHTTITLQLKLITPMFGGGHTAREIDPDAPIRAAAIRGHLRFWWRATAGAQCSTSDELFTREAELWGSASRDNDKDAPGKISIRSEVNKLGTVKASHTWRHPKTGEEKNYTFPLHGWAEYAMHPFQGKKERGLEIKPHDDGLIDTEFTLHITIQNSENSEIQAVLAALKAWIATGGIGARSRRGCGTLQMIASSHTLPELSLLPTTSPVNFPILAGAQLLLSNQKFDKPIDAWKEAVQVYKDFRQRVGFARDASTNGKPAGRSRWSEPDSIKNAITASGLAPRSWHHRPFNHSTISFPRADLGLPIVFHFIDSGDPPDTTLQGPRDGIRRMASPVITKALWDTASSSFRACVCILNAPHAWDMGDLELIDTKRKGHIAHVAPSQVSVTMRSALRTFPTGTANVPVREGFGSYCTTNGFTPRTTL